MRLLRSGLDHKALPHSERNEEARWLAGLLRFFNRNVTP
jgi:hypothetical protein